MRKVSFLVQAKAALALGIKQFIADRPCKNGHFLRSAATAGCVLCDNATVKRWRQEWRNKPESHALRLKFNAAHLDWQRRNPEKQSMMVRRWQKANKEKMREYTRRCNEKRAREVASLPSNDS